MSPTKAENGEYHSLPERQDSHLKWTDDLPECPLSGVGWSTNQVYRAGMRKEEHEFEDRSFHLCLDENTYLYAVFDGEFGGRAVDYASQKMPAAIIFDYQLKDQESDEDIRELLQQAFKNVETTFFQSIDELLVRKENIKEELTGLSSYEALQRHPRAVQQLNSINAKLESATSAVVALIYKNKLYIAHVGNCRALLITIRESGDLKIDQLTVNHDFENEDELLRLSQLGLDTEHLLDQAGHLGHSCTRCIGNYTVKGGYKEYDNLSTAQREPIIAEPEIVCGIPVDDSFKFLLLMSDGLYRSLEQATGTDDVNSLIAHITIEQFSEQSTLIGVAQAVVDKVVRLHHDSFLQNDEFAKNCHKRDDITLLVRNFSQRFEAKSIQNTLLKKSISQSNGTQSMRSISTDTEPRINDNNENVIDNVNQSASLAISNNFHLDDPVDPYVDFSEFYAAVEEAYEKGEVPKSWLRQL